METPVGKIPFTDYKNESFNSLSNVQLIEKYFELYNKTGFIDPHTFQVMKDRRLVHLGEHREDLINRYQMLKKEEMIKELEEIGFSKEEATETVDRELNRKCRICGCTFFNGCQNGCYWIEDDLCSSCR